MEQDNFLLSGARLLCVVDAVAGDRDRSAQSPVLEESPNRERRDARWMER